MKRIAGTISKRPDKENLELVENMLEKLDHIGSEKIESYKANGSVLGICGSGLDIKSYNEARQDRIIVLDGEVYNIDELLDENGLADVKAKAQEEKILELFERKGPDVFREFKGSYAIALSTDKGFVLARDVVGKKPLYYSISEDRQSMVFGSEIKAFEGIYKDINELKPGDMLDDFTGPRTIKKIENRDFEIIEDMDRSEIKNRLRDLLLSSVEKRINSGSRNLGVWLSGGVDSSIIAALLKEFSEKIYTFSVGFEGSPDLESAKIVAEHLDSEHIEYHLDVDELVEMIPEVIYHLESFDAPLVRSSMGNFITSRLSSQADTVFSGEGGDEVFGGYNYFLDLKSDQIIQEGLFEAINSLHNTALQRVDRLASAHGVDIKLPLLDENLIRFALKISPSEKVKKDINMTKYVLRQVAGDYLPDEIAWREKEKFWEGSGILTRLEDQVEEKIDDIEFEDNRILEEGFELRSKEELYYYKVYKDAFPEIDFNKVLAFTSDF